MSYRSSNSSRIIVFLGGLEVNQFTWVPYSRIVVSDANELSEVRVSETDMVSAEELPGGFSHRAIQPSRKLDGDDSKLSGVLFFGSSVF